jgi:hypothetical protein
VHLRLGLSLWVNAIYKTLGFLSSLFIRMRHPAPAGHVYVINFDYPRGNRLFAQLPRDAIGYEFSFVPDRNLMVSIFCFDWIHDTLLPLFNLD